MTRHRNPLFSRRTHVLPTTICVDEMHALHLGVFQDYVLEVLWTCIDNDVWSLRSPQDSKEAFEIRSCHRLRMELFGWYRDERQRFPLRPIYPLGDLDLSVLLNKRGIRRLDAKAAQSGTLVRFAAYAARTFMTACPRGNELLAAGELSVEYLDTRSSPVRMTFPQRQQLMDAVLGYLSLRPAAGIPMEA